MRQPPAERLVSAIEARRNGTDGAAQHLGDLFVGQTLGVAQHDDDALVGGQFFDSALDAAAAFRSAAGRAARRRGRAARP